MESSKCRACILRYTGLNILYVCNVMEGQLKINEWKVEQKVEEEVVKNN